MLSCVGVYSNSQVEIIANDQAWVAFTDRERLIGEVAKSQSAINPEWTNFHFKRLIEKKKSKLSFSICCFVL